MSVKNVEKLEKNQVVLTIEAGAEQFEAALEAAYRKMRGRINLPGFRPGKAPRKMIENMYGAEVFYDEAINQVMPELYAAAIQSEGLEPVGYPEVELLNAGKEGFSFKATLYVYPEVTLGQYKGLTAPKAEVKVGAADVNARLKEMAERNARMETVDRPAEKGDTVNIDFEGFLEGVPFDGGKGENHDLELGSGAFVPGFEEQLTGMSAGEERDIDITFPENYHADLAGKAVVFHVKANAVKVKELPAIDDEFAKDVSEFDTLAELKKDLKAKLTADREESAGHAFEDALMGQVADNIQCDVPAPMVEEQARRFVENMKAQMRQQGIPFEQYLELTGTTEAGMMDQAREPALRQVRLELAIEAIAKAEGIEVSDEDVEAKYQADAAQYGMDAELLKKYMSADVIRDQIRRERVVAVVVDSAEATKPEETEEKPKRSSKKKAEETPEGEEKPKRRRKKAEETAPETQEETAE